MCRKNLPVCKGFVGFVEKFVFLGFGVMGILLCVYVHCPFGIKAFHPWVLVYFGVGV